jgi:antitoxin component of MazEF toxin-antitoxin module
LYTASMKVQVVKWGKGLAVRFPKAAVQKARLKEGDLVKVESNGEGHIELRLADNVPTLRQLVSQITRENRYGEISTSVKIGREKTE